MGGRKNLRVRLIEANNGIYLRRDDVLLALRAYERVYGYACLSRLIDDLIRLDGMED